VTIATTPEVKAGKPEFLFEAKHTKLRSGRRSYDVTPDGQRFLMISGHDKQASATQIHVVLEWFEDLKGHTRTGSR
jgi:hypothetical protein